MPAGLPDLTTLANVKAYAGISITTDDAQLQRLIASMSSRFRAALDRNLTGASYSARLDGIEAGYAGPAALAPARQRIVLKHYPVAAISAVTLYDEDGIATAIPVVSTAVPVPSGGAFAVFEPEPGIVHLVGAWPGRWPRSIAIDFTAGYVTNAALVSSGYSLMPPEIEQAVIEMVLWTYKGKDRLGQTGKTVGGEMVSFSGKQWPDSVQSVIDTYARQGLATAGATTLVAIAT